MRVSSLYEAISVRPTSGFTTGSLGGLWERCVGLPQTRMFMCKNKLRILTSEGCCADQMKWGV